MAAAKLNPEQRSALLKWLAADYSHPVIMAWFAEREWPPISRRALTHYRHKWTGQIEAARQARHSAALTTGLALHEERVARLKDHADALELIKWHADKNGRMWNEKAWRETLDEIAQETGGRVRKAQIGGQIDVYDHRTDLERKLLAHLAPTDATDAPSESDAG